MVTITCNTQTELERMMEDAQRYVCEHRTLPECAKYPRGSCDKCFADHHIECGIRIILSPVDKSNPNNL